MIQEKYRLKNTIKYPTSLIIGGLSKLGLEIADSLIEQGGYVIIVDNYSEENARKLEMFSDDTLVSFIDYTTIPHLDEDIRRLDYVFYFGHESSDFNRKVSTQQFLTFSNYLDATLSLTKKFDAKFLLTTAIRAHQLILSNQDLGLHFGDDMQKHIIYTEMEVQKYAESLVMEYVEKTKLDARIIRLGEIIGEGMDFSKDTTFVELVMSAAKGDNLKLKKDGLETEWYIHVLDGAYGIIKAQFSRSTLGQIYSLSYENPFTNLAVAYKIQEMDTESGDIQFIDEKDNLPSIKLYKPAPNLSQIGWIPKVTLEKAIKQSIAAAKIHLIEMHESKSNKGTLVDKIKGFLAIADSKETISTSDSEAGPVSRLIAERRRQEDLRNKKIEYAADTIKIRKKRKNRTFGDEVKAWLWDVYLNLGNSFGFLKNRTPAQLSMILVIFIAILLSYIYIVSPMLIIGRNLLIMSPEYTKAQVNYLNNNFADLSKNASAIRFYIADTRNAVSSYEVFANLFGFRNNYLEVKEVLSAYELYAEGIENIGYSQEPFNDYLKNYQNNTQLRSATDSYLSISETGLDYSKSLKEQASRLPYLDTGIIKIKKASDQLDSINYSLIPTPLASEFAKINQVIKSRADFTSYSDSLHYLNEILGVNTPQTYLVLLLDNTRQTPVGGEISAFAMFTVKNGSLTEVVVQSPDEIKFNFATLTDKFLKDINNRKVAVKNLSNITLSDIGSIEDYSLFSDVISKVFEATYNRKISAVTTLNYISFDNLLKNLNSKGKTVEVNSVKFGEEDFLQNLKLTQVGNESIQTKHRISAEMLAFVLHNSLSDINSTLPDILNILTKDSADRNVLVNSSSLEYSRYINKADLNANEILDSDSFAVPGMNTQDLKVVTLDKYPSFNFATEITLAKDFSLGYKMNIKFPSIGVAQEISVCLPLYVTDGSIIVSGIPKDRVVFNSGSKEKCIAMQSLTESDVTLNWKVASIGSSLSDNLYSIKLSLAKIRGANVKSDVKISMETGLHLTSITPSVNIVEDSAIFSENLQTDQVIELKVSK